MSIETLRRKKGRKKTAKLIGVSGECVVQLACAANREFGYAWPVHQITEPLLPTHTHTIY